MNNIKIFKLKYSGNLEEIEQDNALNSFTLFDILNFYIPNKRSMYIWIGKKAPQSLKSLIPSIREIISRDYPNLKILRNVTIEFDSEPEEFFEALNISEEEYRNYFKELELKLLPVLSVINRLKEEEDKNFASENYEESIKFARKIIDLANEIEDDSLIRNQQNLIEEASTRAKAKQLLEQIETECNKAIEIFNELIKSENYNEAHDIVLEFRNKFEEKINLFSIPLVQELLLKDENMLYNLREEQEVLKRSLEKMESRLNRLIELNSIFEAKHTLDEGKNLIDKLIDKDLIKKWKNLENTYLEVKESNKKEIIKLDNNALKRLNERNFSEAIEIFEQIIQILEKFIE